MASKSVSGLKVILVGNSRSLKNYVGNLLLKKTVLNTDTKPHNCQTYEGEMYDQPLTVVNTPDLLNTDRAKFIQDIRSLTGPLVFLLVLQPEDFTEKHKNKIQFLLESFSEKVFDQSLLLISTAPAEKPGLMKKLANRVPYRWDQDHRIQNMILKCKNRYLCINPTEDDLKKEEFKRKEMFRRIRKIFRENSEENPSCGPSQEEHTGFSKEKKSPLNLVLCGRAGAEKSSVMKAILGQDSGCSSGQCGRHQAEVFGRWLSVVELPSLSDKPVEEVMELCLSCLSLCAPQGVQAFILVLPLGLLTDEDKAEMKIIQDTFSSAVLSFTKILFTVDSDPSAPAVVDTDLQELSQSCGGGHLIFNTRGQQQLSELLDSVETLTKKNTPQSFTKDTLIYGQRKTIMDLKNGGTVSAPEASADCLRIALMGKTGCGKSSSGNTILGRTNFKAEMSSLSVTQSCGKAEAEVDGRRVVVVDTPGLFDSSLSNDEVMEETSKCVSLLAPGPHVFLLVIQIGRFTRDEKDTVEVIKKGFGKESQKYTMILFTRGDDLENRSIEDYTKNCDSSLQKLLSDCGHRYHVFNNRDKTDRSQVTELIKKIDVMVQENGGDCFTNEMFQNAEASIRKEMERIMKEKEEEMRREREEMERKYLQEIEEKKQKMEKQKLKIEKERQRREQELREKEEKIKMEEKLRKMEQEKREEEERKRREQEEHQHQEWEQKQKDLEEKIILESESKELIEEKLQESRDRMEKERDKWEKERTEWWEKREQENEAGQQKLKDLQEEYDRKRKEDEEKKQEEDRNRRVQEEETIKEIRDKHEKEMEESIIRSKHEARAEAEEAFHKKELEKMEAHRRNINDLVRCVCKKKENVEKINNLLRSHSRMWQVSGDREKKEALKQQDRELSELIQRMLKEDEPSLFYRIMESVVPPVLFDIGKRFRLRIV